MVGWSDIQRVIAGLFDFGRLRGSRVTTSHQVVVNLRGIAGPRGNEDVDDCEHWGVAGVQSRPKPPSSSGGQERSAEYWFMRNNDELLAVASRDLRYLVNVEEGELAIHALGRDGATQAVVRCKPNGEVIVSGTTIYLGTTATDFVANARLVNAELVKIATAIQALSGSYVWTVADSVGVSKVKAE